MHVTSPGAHRARLTDRRGAKFLLAILVAACATLLFASAAFASFGIKSLTGGAFNKDGSSELQAGSHPFQYTLGFSMNLDSQGRPEGTLRDVVVDLPAGMVGNPLAVPRCKGSAFEGFGTQCPANTQVGVAHIALTENAPKSPVYNLTPPAGVPASIGFSIVSENSFLEASLRSSDYGVRLSDITLPTDLSILSISETVWGAPAIKDHDGERGECAGVPIPGCAIPSEVAPAPFLTLPTSCNAPLTTTVKVDSLEEPGVFQEKSVQSLGEDGTPAALNSCERLPFSPRITAQPQTSAADSPTGLHVNLHIPQNQDLEGLATANLKDTVVSLPPGMVVNPSAADGLGACRPAQIGLHEPGQAQCPDASKIGTAQVETPLVDHPLPGSVYLAKQGENPFNSLLALYVAVDDPVTGIVVKLAGKVEADPVTGQLKATFLNNPQLPFEDFDLDFFGGPRATLTTPSTCGTFTTTSDLTPWSSPEGADVFPSDSFQVNAGANGGGCVTSEAQEPNTPALEAGSTTPLGGAYTPFVLKLSRENGSQRFSALNVTLPPGLTGKLAGVARCSDAQLAAAAARGNPGQGASELSSPSCPVGSEVGSVTVGAGSGSPLFVGGHAYLAGPYRGAPFSLAIITPAVAGPFDLGVVVVRSPLYINPETAQVTVESDPIPSILQGIPLDVRSIEVSMSRPEFTLNPTNCDAMAVGGEVISTIGQHASLSKRFQVSGCQGLSFKPSFSASTQAKTSKANGASLTVKVSQKPGEANIHKVVLQLPKVLPSRLTTLQKACTEAQFNANPAGCPEGSFIGTATAKTPILDSPLAGPAILVSHGGAAFPDVEFLLQGEGVHITLDGKTDIKKGITFSRFETVPDAPIGSFETVLPEGPHSVLTATANICGLTKTVTRSRKVTRRIHGRTKRVTLKVMKLVAEPLQILTTIIAQNGAQVTQTTKIAVTGCTRVEAKKKSAKAKGKHRGKKRTPR